MYKNLILFLIGYISLLGLPAQQTYFNKALDFGNKAEWGYDIIKGYKNGYISVNTYTDSTGEEGTFILRINKKGTITEQKFLLNDTLTIVGFKIMKSTPDSGYFILSQNFNNSLGDWQYGLLKLNKDLDVEFIKSYGDTSKTEYSQNFIFTEHKNIYIVGTRNNDFQDIFIIQVDQWGNKIKEIQYGLPDAYENAYGIIEHSDGSLILAGYRLYGGTESFDWLITRLDSSGNKIWEKTFGGPYKDICEGLARVDSNTVIAAGFDVKKEDPLTTDAVAKRIRISDGSVVWSNSYKLDNSDNKRYLFDLGSTPLVQNDKIVIFGGTRKQGKFYRDYGFYYTARGFLVQMDLDGNKEWMRQYYNDPSKHQYFRAMTPTNDGGYLLTGSVLNQPNDLWLLKVDSQGCAVPRCDTICGRLSGDFTYERISNDSFQYQLVDTSQAVNFRKWTFGDGEETPDSIAPDTVTHTYATEGTYEV